MVQKIIGDELVTTDRQTDNRQTDRQTDIFELTPIHMGNFNLFFFCVWEGDNKWGEIYTSLLRSQGDKGESVCVCVCVCMSGGLPPDLHNQSPWNLAWAPHFTLARHRARGRPQMLTPGGTPIVTPSEKPWRVKNCVGASKQKLLLGVVFHVKFYLWGAHPNLVPAGSTLPNGLYALRIGRGPANKSCSLGWVCI